jgi:hypothetical protein
MEDETPQIALQLRELGRVVTYWNELEWQVRWILMHLAPDLLTAGMFAADMQISALLASTRMFGREKNAINDRAAELLASEEAKAYEPFFLDLEFYLEAVDRLREHRNHVVHNSRYSRDNTQHLLTAKMTARGRLKFHTDKIETQDLAALSAQIETFILYGERWLAAFQINESADADEQPTWPERPPLPDKLAILHPTFLDVLPRPEPSQG